MVGWMENEKLGKRGEDKLTFGCGGLRFKALLNDDHASETTVVDPLNFEQALKR